MPETPRPSQRLRRNQRITRSGDFQAVYDGGRKQVGPGMVFWVLPREDQPYRLGVVASRKVGGAVIRVRARRRLREVFRRHRALLTGGGDVVLIARKGGTTRSWEALCREWLGHARRLGLLRDGDPTI